MDGSSTNASRAQAFPRSARLIKKAEFQRVFAQGRKSFSPEFAIYVLPNDVGQARLGMAIGRKAGKSVQRSRIKRLLREAFRQGRGAWPAMDVVVVARSAPVALTLELARQRLEAAVFARREAKAVYRACVPRRDLP